MKIGRKMNTKTNLINKVESIFLEILDISNFISNGFEKTSVVQDAVKSDIGIKILKLRDLNSKLITFIEVGVDALGIELTEFSSDVQEYYNTVSQVTNKNISLSEIEKILKEKDETNKKV